MASRGGVLVLGRAQPFTEPQSRVDGRASAPGLSTPPRDHSAAITPALPTASPRTRRWRRQSVECPPPRACERSSPQARHWCPATRQAQPRQYRAGCSCTPWPPSWPGSPRRSSPSPPCPERQRQRRGGASASSSSACRCCPARRRLPGGGARAWLATRPGRPRLRRPRQWRGGPLARRRACARWQLRWPLLGGRRAGTRGSPWKPAGRTTPPGRRPAWCAWPHPPPPGGPRRQPWRSPPPWPGQCGRREGRPRRQPWRRRRPACRPWILAATPLRAPLPR
mmetsp:Transcript_16541/g.62577  ORF Transcript_16541/g.62577 Transcript_16541/m.62577 type:complete len:281 (-) Transcript_16541:554-1396(-)